MEIKKTLQVQAYEYIKGMILKGTLEYEAIYSETKIAKELGISRTPMRDAIQYLSQERYIDIIPNKGFRLHRMSMEDFIQTYQIRTAIEGYCARQLAMDFREKKGIETIRQLTVLLDRQKKEIDGVIEEYLEADTVFHKTLVGYIDNQELIDLFDTYIYRMRNMALHSLGFVGRRETAYREHLEIYEAIRSGDSISAYEKIVIHMENPKNISVDYVQ